ncbi:hypothetical protein [Fusobacterium sp. PH5-44]|uniref:hypothetical protein n=1 Tax=unclassified Fusobacterium TaxID=2648384 RepID=UPI003D1BD400
MNILFDKFEKEKNKIFDLKIFALVLIFIVMVFIFSELINNNSSFMFILTLLIILIFLLDKNYKFIFFIKLFIYNIAINILFLFLYYLTSKFENILTIILYCCQILILPFIYSYLFQRFKIQSYKDTIDENQKTLQYINSLENNLELKIIIEKFLFQFSTESKADSDDLMLTQIEMNNIITYIIGAKNQIFNILSWSAILVRIVFSAVGPILFGYEYYSIQGNFTIFTLIFIIIMIIFNHLKYPTVDFKNIDRVINYYKKRNRSMSNSSEYKRDINILTRIKDGIINSNLNDTMKTTIPKI